jgi:hypothetical protein
VSEPAAEPADRADLRRDRLGERPHRVRASLRRIYYTAPVGGVDFNDDKAKPDYRDFADVALTIGMTFQVSDTDLATSTLRRTAIMHALLSYLFGVVIMAITINTVAGLLANDAPSRLGKHGPLADSDLLMRVGVLLGHHLSLVSAASVVLLGGAQVVAWLVDVDHVLVCAFV